MTTTRTIYAVKPKNSYDGEPKSILVVREDDKVVRVEDFGFKAAYGVAQVLRQFTGMSFYVVHNASRAALRKEIGSLKGLDLYS